MTVNLSLLGKAGFEEVARSCLARTEYLRNCIDSVPGFAVRYKGPCFNELAVRCEGRKAAEVLDAMADRGFLAGVDLLRFDPVMDDTFLVAVTECNTRDMIDGYIAALKEV